jgi:hypothetical protein
MPTTAGLGTGEILASCYTFKIVFQKELISTWWFLSWKFSGNQILHEWSGYSPLWPSKPNLIFVLYLEIPDEACLWGTSQIYNVLPVLHIQIRSGFYVRNDWSHWRLYCSWTRLVSMPSNNIKTSTISSSVNGGHLTWLNLVSAMGGHFKK